MGSWYQSGEIDAFQPIYTRGKDQKCYVLIGSLVLASCVNVVLILVSSA